MIQATTLSAVWIPDMLVGAVLLAAAWLRGKKGLYHSLMPLVVTIASLICAIFASAVLTEPVTELVYPVVEDAVLRTVHTENLPTENLEQLSVLISDVEGMTQQLEELLPGRMIPMLTGLGVDLKEFLSELIGTVKNSGTLGTYLNAEQLAKLEGVGIDLRNVTGELRGSVRTAVDVETILFTAVFSLARRLTSVAVHFFLWLLSLIFFRVVFTVLKNMLGLTVRLPVIGWADWLGGAALGVLECGILLFVIGWLARFLGFTALHDMGAGTRLYALFF